MKKNLLEYPAGATTFPDNIGPGLLASLVLRVKGLRVKVRVLRARARPERGSKNAGLTKRDGC
jgi:hypothetical protein